MIPAELTWFTFPYSAINEFVNRLIASLEKLVNREFMLGTLYIFVGIEAS
jgi:hypothetical protein